MLASVPQMTWFANLKMLLRRLVDKMDGGVMRALFPHSSGFGLVRFPARRGFSGAKPHLQSAWPGYVIPEVALPG